jgi:hypothetical protein
MKQNCGMDKRAFRLGLGGKKEGFKKMKQNCEMDKRAFRLGLGGKKEGSKKRWDGQVCS